jgi:hypothetical protein
MNRKTIIIILVSVLGATLIVLGIRYLHQYLPKYKWYETYNIKSEEPYGTHYIYSLLKKSDQFRLINRPLKQVLDSSLNNNLYIFIGGNYYPDSAGLESLIKFVKRGNKVFISSNVAPSRLLDELPYTTDPLYSYRSIKDSVVHIKFTNPALENDDFSFHFQILKKKSIYYWNYFDQDAYEYAKNGDYKIHSYIDDHQINMFSIKYGSGEFFFHSNPVLFTNYYLVREKGYRYLNDIFSVIGGSDNIYWDEFSKIPNLSQNYMVSSPFQFILSKDSLRYAFYLIIVLILLHLLFHSKRIQAVIPIYESKKNTSIEFVKAVGTLYAKKSTHIDLGKDIMKLFLSYVRSRYGINTKIEREQLIKKIAVKSEIPERKIKRIFDYSYSVKYDPKVEKSTVIQLHQSIEYFYKNCK